MKKDAAAASEKKDGADDESYELDSSDEEAKQDPLTPAKDLLTPAKGPSPDKGVFIGFRYDGTEIRSKGLPVEAVKQLMAIAQECKHIVDR